MVWANRGCVGNLGIVFFAKAHTDKDEDQMADLSSLRSMLFKKILVKFSLSRSNMGYLGIF